MPAPHRRHKGHLSERLLLPAIWLACLLPLHGHAAAWLQDKDDVLFIQSLYLYQTDNYIDTSGTRRDQPRYAKTTYQQYAEWGFRDDLTLGAKWSLTQARQSGNRHSGIEEISLFARTPLPWGGDEEVISIQPLIKFPSPADQSRRPAFGSDEWEAELRLLYGRNWAMLSQRGFLNGEAAYRHRTGSLSDQWLADATLGWDLPWESQLLLQSFNTFRLGSRVNSFTNSPSDDYSLSEIHLGAVHRVSEDITLHGGFYQQVWGRNTGQGHGFILGLWKRF